MRVRSTVFLPWFFVSFAFAAGCSDSAPSSSGTAMGSAGASTASAASGSGVGGGAGATTGVDPSSTGGSGPGGVSGAGGAGGSAEPGTGGNPALDAAISEGGSGTGGTGAGGQPGTGGAGDAGGSKSFKCTLIIGCFQTSQWFDGGFETAVGTAKWEIKWAHNTFTEHWASPTDPFWDLPVTSPCASGATAPDRVLFISYSTTLTTEAAWEMALTRVVDNVKTKFPSVQQIELLGMARAPNNQMCANNTNVSTIVKPEEDQAMQAVADKSSGFVQTGPKYFAPSCDSFITNNTTLTTAGASAVATMLSGVYK